MKFKKIELTKIDKIFIKIFFTTMNVIIMMSLGIWLASIIPIVIPIIVLLCIYITFKIWEDILD